MTISHLKGILSRFRSIDQRKLKLGINLSKTDNKRSHKNSHNGTDPLDLHCPFVQDLKYKSSSNEVFLPDSDFIGHGIYIVVMGSCGIPKWIRNQRKGNEITMDLPRNCYKNNDFLGIAICCVYVPLDECEDIPENDFAHTSEN